MCRRRFAGKLDPAKRKFLDQHLQGAAHVKNAAMWQQDQHGKHGPSDDQQPQPLQDIGDVVMMDVKDMPKCQGFHVNRGPASAKVTKLHAAFELWACNYNPLKSMQHLHSEEGENHTYHHDMNSGGNIIRHHHCEEHAPPQDESQPEVPPVWFRCAKLGNTRSILRMVQRFPVKHTGARRLAACLFEPDYVERLVQEIKDGPAYAIRATELDAVFGLTTVALQNFVRSQFLCLAPGRWSEALRDFVSSSVMPCSDLACVLGGKGAESTMQRS